MGDTAGAPLLVERHGPVGWLTFHRPEVGNAMDAAMMAALPDAWAELDADPGVRAIVVTGAGRAFQTGLDVAQLSRSPEALREMSRRTKRGDLRLTGWHLGVATPVVTAVNGVCAGGGLHFVADSDIVIASTRASFLDPHVSVGQASAFEPIGLARRASFAPVARMALTGAHERVTAAEALRLGWVSEVVAPGGLREAAQRLGERLAENDAAAVAATKRALWRALETGLTRAREENAGER
ncbi:enoyl-CoA hydratase/isomerase family protein [Actinomadura viridis]|uniref:Enoyl-CoA hydratase/carnithine racemase n=1 Tax=Actinomadura viridis TaxID=58110 RepID=A0A931GIX6_9ACTN|nr:enoyl-CoA hydratase/isomerase family protein [Actinomadura viridis]MBG6089073.1 enoyl-CoA hydratase/carnithine racemase [Actinomadura viridis]